MLSREEFIKKTGFPDTHWNREDLYNGLQKHFPQLMKDPELNAEIVREVIHGALGLKRRGRNGALITLQDLAKYLMWLKEGEVPSNVTWRKFKRVRKLSR